MHGDITRSTFTADRPYTSVRLQQGRVQLDADWNEDRDIALADERAWRRDVMGQHGGPGRGLKVAGGNALTVAGGRYYVDGLRLDVPDTTLTATTGNGPFLIHLDVWERTVTAAEDPRIRDVALGGPDTATRTALAWRLGALPVTAVPVAGTDPAEWLKLVAGSTGTMTVTTGAAPAATDPDVVPASLGYRGLTNRTYRVQVHKGTADPTTGAALDPRPTVLWARDNASVLATWTSLSAAGAGRHDIGVDRPGPGGADGFRPGAFAELTNLERQLARLPGLVCRIVDVAGGRLTVEDPASAETPLDTVFAGHTPTVRCWAGVVAVPGAPPATPGTSDTVALEDGLAVTFTVGASATYRTGDFWIVPARSAATPGVTAADLVDWPRGDGGPLAVGPHGPAHHWARLAVVTRSGTTWTVQQDNRRVFAPLGPAASDALGDAPFPVAEVAAVTGPAPMRCELLGDGEPLALDPTVVVGRGTWTGRLALHLPVTLDDDPTLRALHAAVTVSVEVPVDDGPWAGTTVAHRLPGAAELVTRGAGACELHWSGGDTPVLADGSDDEVLVRVEADPALLGVPGAAVYRAAFTVRR